LGIVIVIEEADNIHHYRFLNIFKSHCVIEIKMFLQFHLVKDIFIKKFIRLFLLYYLFEIILDKDKNDKNNCKTLSIYFQNDCDIIHIWINNWYCV